MYRLLLSLEFVLLIAVALTDSAGAAESVIRSAESGNWSAGVTWEGGKVPGEGAKVLIRPGHRVVYDVKNEVTIRGVNVAGTLSFAADRSTQLNVGLLKIQNADEYSEEGFDCEAHGEPLTAGMARAALEVGTQQQPIPSEYRALIRLVYVEGMDKNSCPALVCCGGRMDLHGAPLVHTWTKLGNPAAVDDAQIVTRDVVGDWRVGDRLIVTATTRQSKVKKTFKTSTREGAQTEERIITAVKGNELKLDKPLAFAHTAEGDYRADVANLSRNVIVESADPAGVRGHTMYHRDSAGSVSYTEFRHLGKENVLGRYSLHFHLVGDTMRGSSVIGASIWDSGNRWITVHGTNYLVVRDCVGYQSIGHGYFLEDGSEVFNVFDHCLAVQAFLGKPLPKQVLPFDKNDGSGFWWSNCHNTFTRNTACECDEYGYFFQAPKTAEFDLALDVQRPNGKLQKTDIRTLPFIRFEDNEAHCQRRHSFNLGGGVPFGNPNVDGVGPDAQHPLIVRKLNLWNVHWGIHPVSPSVVLDGVEIHQSEYGIWRPVYNQHVYRDLKLTEVPVKLHYAFVDGPPPAAELDPEKLTDDLPPTTVITHVLKTAAGKLLVRGTTSDNAAIKEVQVNGQAARATAANFAQWEIELAGDAQSITAHAQDAAGNREPRPHVWQR